MPNAPPAFATESLSLKFAAIQRRYVRSQQKKSAIIPTLILRELIRNSKVTMNQPAKNIPSAADRCPGTDVYASLIPNPGIRMAEYDNQNPPYRVKNVAPKVFPYANSHIPARSKARPPTKRDIPMIAFWIVTPLVWTMYMDKMNVVVAKAYRPRGPGLPSILKFCAVLWLWVAAGRVEALFHGKS